jgi:hypothetical protein
MEIVNRKKFLTLPSGVLYSKYESSGMVSGLYEKGESWTNDWIYADLLGEVESNNSEEFHTVFEEAENGKKFILDYESGSRDGAFEDDNMFMIYDKADVNKLIKKLTDISLKY